ncbi:MAG: OmpA family protein [Elusimicrobiota bacterium]|nr:OmpA family protein [Elusimicrobiota bacterium]
MLLVFAAVAAGACASKKTRPAPSADKTGHATEEREASIRGHQFASVADLRVVSFEYDSDRFSRAGLEILKSNAAAIKRNSEWEVLVEGHCDQRGTVEYNLALGQRRAKAVRDYYVLLGIPGRRIATLSYGAELTSCSEATEGCWAQNRRVESKVKTTMAKRTR